MAAGCKGHSFGYRGSVQRCLHDSCECKMRHDAIPKFRILLMSLQFFFFLSLENEREIEIEDTKRQSDMGDRELCSTKMNEIDLYF